jgi:hypothetical protein
MDDMHRSTVGELHGLARNIVEQCPELEGRVARAVAILLLGKCSPISETTFEVLGTEATPYTVDVAAETCSCADFQHRAPEYKGAKWCKHRVSVCLLRKLGGRRESARAARLSTFRPACVRRAQRLIGRVAA